MNLMTMKTHDPDESRWQKVLDRDKASDGAFVYAVRTTGVYCRPSCPSRRGKRENVQFFDGCEDAERAGFRKRSRRRTAPAMPRWWPLPAVSSKRRKKCHPLKK